MYDDIPPHMVHEVWGWTEKFIGQRNRLSASTVRALANHMRYDWQGITMGGLQPELRVYDYIQRRFLQEPEQQLAAIEYFLADSAAGYGDLLRQILDRGNSAYTVSDDGKRLEMRVDPTFRAQVEQTVDQADPGASHWLKEAWNDAYGREPRPGTSYEASIRAVEAALRGIVVPDNGRATITQVINAVRDGKAKAKFRFVLEDARGDAAGRNEPVIDAIDTVLAMLRALAYGQRTRHGTEGDVTINSVEEARTAMQIAVALVQFGTPGYLVNTAADSN